MFEKRRGGLKGESLCKFKKNEMWMFLEWVCMPSFLDPLIFLTFIIVFKIKIDGNSPGFHEAYLNGRIFFFYLYFNGFIFKISFPFNFLTLICNQSNRIRLCYFLLSLGSNYLVSMVSTY